MTNRLHRALGAGLVLAVTATACSSSHRPSASPATSSTTEVTTPAPTSTSPSSVSTTSAPTSTTAVTTPSGPAACATASLAGSLTAPSGAAGSIYYLLVLTNRGSSTCVLDGYPGVSFLSDANQVGAPAAHTTGSTAAPITLAPGASAGAPLQITEAANYADCGVRSTDALRVYPPNQFTALTVAHNDQACSNTNDVTLHVGPFKR